MRKFNLKSSSEIQRLYRWWWVISIHSSKSIFVVASPLLFGWFHAVLRSIQAYSVPTRPWKLVELAGALLDFLFDFNLELTQLFFNPIIDMATVREEFIVVVLLSFIGVVQVPAILPNVVDGALYHIFVRHVASNELVPFDLSLGGNHRHVVEVQVLLDAWVQHLLDWERILVGLLDLHFRAVHLWRVSSHVGLFQNDLDVLVAVVKTITAYYLDI